MNNPGGFSAFGFLVCLALGGCVTSVNNPAGVAHVAQEKLVVAGLSEELIYEYLLGDIAARRGDTSTAAGAMARAAELSSSLQITLRAFSMSMESGDYEQALDLSELLESIDPDQQEHALR